MRRTRPRNGMGPNRRSGTVCSVRATAAASIALQMGRSIPASESCPCPCSTLTRSCRTRTASAPSPIKNLIGLFAERIDGSGPNQQIVVRIVPAPGFVARVPSGCLELVDCFNRRVPERNRARSLASSRGHLRGSEHHDCRHLRSAAGGTAPWPGHAREVLARGRSARACAADGHAARRRRARPAGLGCAAADVEHAAPAAPDDGCRHRRGTARSRAHARGHARRRHRVGHQPGHVRGFRGGPGTGERHAFRRRLRVRSSRSSAQRAASERRRWR